MANILTSFIPTLFQSLDKVSRELVGFIPSVARNSSAARAALNESILVPVSTPTEAKDCAPSMNVPEPDDMKLDNVEIKITKSKNVSFGLTGEDYKGLENGIGVSEVFAGKFEQAIRTLTNMIESDVAAEAAISASRAFGTPGTAPFASDLKDAAQVRKILDDNGAPMSGRSLIIDTNAGVNLRGLTQLTNAGDAGTTMTLRQGQLLDLFGLSVKESAQIKSFAKGSAEGATVNTAEVGATELTLKAGTSGNLKAGDVITLAGDSNKYVVMKDVAISIGNKIEIAQPGLRVAASDGAAITVGESSIRNVAFNRDAIQLVTRAPALPADDDSADDSYMLTDPRSGMSYEVRVYKGYRKQRVEVACAWGVKAIKPAHIAALLG